MKSSQDKYLDLKNDFGIEDSLEAKIIIWLARMVLWKSGKIQRDLERGRYFQVKR